jgi:hypothetical protein
MLIQCNICILRSFLVNMLQQNANTAENLQIIYKKNDGLKKILDQILKEQTKL